LGLDATTKFVMFGTTLVSFWCFVDNHANKDDLKFLKQLWGVNERSNGDKVMFKRYKHVGLIRDNITIEMSKVIGRQLQHGFHNEHNFYSNYVEAQRGATNMC
jgi:hypothetical protein